MTGSVPAPRIVDPDEVIGVTVPPIVAVAAPVAVIVLIVMALRWLARPHSLMYVEIRRRCAEIQARTTDQTPVPRHSVDGPAARAGTPDPARAVTPQRVHIEMGGRGRHREAA